MISVFDQLFIYVRVRSKLKLNLYVSVQSALANNRRGRQTVRGLGGAGVRLPAADGTDPERLQQQAAPYRHVQRHAHARRGQVVPPPYEGTHQCYRRTEVSYYLHTIFFCCVRLSM